MSILERPGIDILEEIVIYTEWGPIIDVGDSNDSPISSALYGELLSLTKLLSLKQINENCVGTNLMFTTCTVPGIILTFQETLWYRMEKDT